MVSFSETGKTRRFEVVRVLVLGLGGEIVIVVENQQLFLTC